ncbi:MAG: AzlC family ABC transporter permease [Alphaproteobacteria bacterium]|nr:AzlC family ABC transporter permease [Alphaproteobacteria bacterium]MCW5741647.1 AzlC family ABC transporter permease [Alphaproteobacteria bacterium]
MTHTAAPLTFTLNGLRQGALAVGVLLPGTVMFAMAFGVVARATGLGLGEATLLSAWVYAGGAQMATLQVWADPVPLLAVVLTTLAMNSRYLLLGAAMRPWFGGLPAGQSYPSLFVLGDANAAMALRRHAEGDADAAFVLGSGAAMWLAWVAGTAAGHGFGQALGDPRRLGIDFMLGAFFATMAAGWLESRGNLVPFVVGVVCATVVDRLLGAPWSVLAGAVAGALTAGLRR